MTTRIGVDVGGTFTDFVVENPKAPDPLRVWKTPTTRPDPSVGIFDGLRQLTGLGHLDPRDVSEISVGTTVALNAILEGRGARTGMLVTRGFRDVLDIGRENRALLYDLQQEKLPVLVERQMRIEIDERMASDGSVIRAMDPEAVRAAAGMLRAAGAEAVAVCFLHSYANPAHEQEARRIVEEAHPEIAVSASHSMSTDYREYERWLLAVLNAYVMPVMMRYVDGLQRGVEASSPDARIFVTHSAGGVMSTSTAVRRPIQSALSGPAAGVLGAQQIAELAGVGDFITMDMGGTSCDVAVVLGGAARLSPSMDLRGYQIGLRGVDVNSISAGGGTIAWVDPGGLLRVGPESAGSVPGPAAYGRGGSLPTVTDAHVVLGHIDPQAVLGDSIRLDLGAASEAVRIHIADPMGMTLIEAARGIVEIADAAMTRAMEVVSIERGHDPRDFALIAFGGAAPLHASKVAHELGIRRILVPRHAGVLCALGTLSASEYHEVSRSVLARADNVDSTALGETFSQLVEELRGLVADEDRSASALSYSVDVRYIGQTAFLEVPLSSPQFTSAMVEQLRDAYEEMYHQVFGYSIPGNEIEIVAARASVRVPRERASVPVVARSTSAPARPWRAVFEGSEPIDCLLYGPSSLVPGAELIGPCVIDSGGASTLVLTGQRATVDDFGNLIIESASTVQAEG